MMTGRNLHLARWICGNIAIFGKEYRDGQCGGVSAIVDSNFALFENRQHAGRELARSLEQFRGSGAIVLAIPRGGVIVGFEVSRALDLKLDVIVSRKIGAPDQPELAIGAVASWGDHDAILDKKLISMLNVSRDYIEHEAQMQLSEINRRLNAYRGTLDPPEVKNKSVLLVDDGIATGYTIRAASVALRNLGASRIILAVPVAPQDSLNDISPYFDDIICLKTPYPFFAVGYWYKDFTQVTDDEVIALIRTDHTI